MKEFKEELKIRAYIMMYVLISNIPALVCYVTLVVLFLSNAALDKNNSGYYYMFVVMATMAMVTIVYIGYQNKFIFSLNALSEKGEPWFYFFVKGKIKLKSKKDGRIFNAKLKSYSYVEIRRFGFLYESLLPCELEEKYYML